MDDFLNQFRKEPNPEFAKRLYERINQPMERKANTQLSRRIAGAWKPALVGAAVVLAAVLAFSPSARVMAQNFLDMFRVKNFAAVKVDPARMAQISNAASAKRSSTESRKAPNLLSRLVARARAPSSASRGMAVKVITRPPTATKPNPINTPATTFSTKPVTVSTFGGMPAPASALTTGSTIKRVFRRAQVSTYSPLMKASTFEWATSSIYCSGGDFMK